MTEYQKREITKALPAGDNSIGKFSLEKSIGTPSTDNSTTTPLGIDGVFTGTAEDVLNHSIALICVFADQDSALLGLSVQWSCDGINWDLIEEFNVTANVGRQHSFGFRARYFRIIYTNGGVAQSAFRLQVIFKPIKVSDFSRSLRKDIDKTDIVPTRRVVISAQKPGDGDFANIQATTAGNLKTAIEEFDCSLPAGTNNIGDVNVDKAIGTISTNNSTSTPLGISEVFSGGVDDVKDYASIQISIVTDKDSASDGLNLQWSSNGTNWDHILRLNVQGGKYLSFELGPRARYFRIIYANGAAAQSAFRMQVIYRSAQARKHQTPLDVVIEKEDLVPTRRAVIAAQKPGNGDYTNIQATTVGNLKTAIEEFDTSLPAGTNNIGDVDVLSLPAGTVAGGSSLPAGSNNIGDVDVASLPSIPAGNNNIGNVDVVSTVGVSNRSSWMSGVKTIAAAGTAEQLPSQAIPNGFAVIITSDATNNSEIYLGNSKANAEDPTVAFKLNAGEGIRLKITNLNLVWLDEVDATDFIRYLVET